MKISILVILLLAISCSNIKPVHQKNNYPQYIYTKVKNLDFPITYKNIIKETQNESN